MTQKNYTPYETPCANELELTIEGILCSSITNYGKSGFAGDLEEGNIFEF